MSSMSKMNIAFDSERYNACFIYFIFFSIHWSTTYVCGDEDMGSMTMFHIINAS